MVDFGSRIKMLRQQKGLTQSQVAERIGGSKAMVSSYELGTRYPSYDMLIKLARLYGVSTDYLLGQSINRSLNVDDLAEENIMLIKSLIDALKRKT